MPKFVLVDNSLAPAGGHHFEFAESILSTAEAAGYSPFLGANLELPKSAELSKRWPTHRVFPSSIYHDFNLFYLQRWEERESSKKFRAWPGPLRRVSEWYNEIRSSLRRRRWATKRAMHCDGFVDGCTELFGYLPPLEKGDIVMLPTVSDVELEALGTFLRDNPATAVAQWHLYFHNNFLIGRTHEYESQRFRMGLMEKSLRSCLEGGKNHDLRFYTTTEQLADQFERLKLNASFHRLTFPVREALRGVVPPTGDIPKRVVCAGGFRDERGQFTLPQIVSAVWSDLLKPGRVQIHVQRDKPEWQVPLPAGANATDLPAPPIVYHPHPLSTEAYNQLIQEADIGLLLHDPHSYYSRLSAVYQEYVCAGIPVILPAGCWLGDQVADENSRYVERLMRDRQSQIVQHDAVSWRLGGGKRLAAVTNGRLSFRGPSWPLSAEFSLPNGATELVVQVRWPEPNASGQYIRATLELPTPDGRWQTEAQAALGPGKTSANYTTMFHLRSGWPRARLLLSNAFGSEPITVASPQLTFLAAPSAGSAGLPLGQSGLSFAERSEIPRLLREILSHYDHYRLQAQEKSPSWCQKLKPSVTLSQITSHSGESSARVNRAA